MQLITKLFIAFIIFNQPVPKFRTQPVPEFRFPFNKFTEPDRIFTNVESSTASFPAGNSAPKQEKCFKPEEKQRTSTVEIVSTSIAVAELFCIVVLWITCSKVSNFLILIIIL